jgi:uncharacterized coiled-coil protein SlyX
MASNLKINMDLELQLETTEKTLVSCAGRLVEAEKIIDKQKDKIDSLEQKLNLYKTLEEYNINGFIYLNLVTVHNDSSKSQKLIKITATVKEYERFMNNAVSQSKEFVYSEFLDVDQLREYRDAIRNAVSLEAQKPSYKEVIK